MYFCFFNPFFSKAKAINEYSFTKEVATVPLISVLIEIEALSMYLYKLAVGTLSYLSNLPIRKLMMDRFLYECFC